MPRRKVKSKIRYYQTRERALAYIRVLKMRWPDAYFEVKPAPFIGEFRHCIWYSRNDPEKGLITAYVGA